MIRPSTADGESAQQPKRDEYDVVTEISTVMRLEPVPNDAQVGQVAGRSRSGNAG
jgi:hypothetical protein